MRMLLFLALVACGGDSDDPSDTDDTDSDPVAEDTWDNFAADFFAGSCVGCHTASPRDFRTLADVTAHADEIRCIVAPTEPTDCDPAVRANHPAWNAPADAQRQRLVDWIEAGLP